MEKTFPLMQKVFYASAFFTKKREKRESFCSRKFLLSILRAIPSSGDVHDRKNYLGKFPARGKEAFRDLCRLRNCGERRPSLMSLSSPLGGLQSIRKRPKIPPDTKKWKFRWIFRWMMDSVANCGAINCTKLEFRCPLAADGSHYEVALGGALGRLFR